MMYQQVIQGEQKFGKDAFRFLIEKPPSTRELKEPELYLKRDLSTGSKHM